MQLFPQPEWEKRMFPGNSDNMPVQFHHRRQSGAGVGLETQSEEDGVSEDHPEVEWGSREWERLRLEEKVFLCTTDTLHRKRASGLIQTTEPITQQADRWGFPREYTERRLQELQSEGRAENDCANKSVDYSVWRQYGNASKIVLDNSTLFLSKHGNDSLFMTPTRPESFHGLRPSCFLTVFPNSQAAC